MAVHRGRGFSGSSGTREIESGRLYGREQELAALRGVLDGASADGGAMLLRGDAGIGKSAILAALTEHAAGLGMHVLSTVGVQSEARLSYAGLHQVVRPVIGLAEGLPPRQRDALLAAFAMAEGDAPEVFFIGLATLELLGDAAERAPVLVVVEDAQWLDDASAAVLAFVARRVEANIVIAIAIRSGHVSPFDESGLAELRLPALDALAAGALLDARAPGLGASMREWIIDEAEGNPLALIELPVALDAGRLAQDIVGVTRLPLTERLERAFAAQESGLPPATRSLLLAAAADDGSALDEVLRAASILEKRELTLEALEPAIAMRLVEVDGRDLRFRHPLVRSAIYQGVVAPRRQAAHAALADVLSGQPDRRIWHRAAGIIGANEQVAAELEQVASRAERRGAFDLAITGQKRAAALSESALRAGRLLGAAEIAFGFGRVPIGEEFLQEAEQLELSRPERTRVSWLREVYLSASWSGSAKVAAFVEIAEQMRIDGRSDLALTTLLGVAERCWWSAPDADVSAAVVTAAERIDPTGSDPRFLQILACAAPATRRKSLIEQLARTPVDVGDPDGMATLGVAASLLASYEDSLRFLGPAIDVLRAQGRLAPLVQALVSQAWGAVHLARGPLAVAAAEEAATLGRETGQRRWTSGAHFAHAAIDAERGDIGHSETLIREATAILAPIGATPSAALIEFVRGRAAVAHQRYEEGFEHLQRSLDPTDPSYHPNIGAWGLSDLVEAAAHTGRREIATQYSNELESQAVTTHAPLSIAQAAYARPFVASDADAEGLYQIAIQQDLVGWPCYRGRMLLWYGRWLRRQRRVAESRTPLRAARDLFDALAFPELAEHARRELRASGETSRSRTPDARDQLTPQELQIAQLAADGLSNREIGQQLYISHRTVGYHLHHIFPKLGITSRTQLRPALLGPSLGAPK